MKKNTKKKTLTAVTGATVIGVAAAALVNGSKLETVFNPDKFEKFDNKYSSEEYDYVAGDGEETNIAGNSKKDKEKSGGDDLQVLQLKKKESGSLKNSDSFGIADNVLNYENTDTPADEETAPNSVEVAKLPETQTPQEPEQQPSQPERNNSSISNPVNTNPATKNPSGQDSSNNKNGNGSNNSDSKITVTPVPGQNGSSSNKKNPTGTPTPEPANTPTPKPNRMPTPEPNDTPTPEPENTPTPRPENTPTPRPENTPTPEPENTPMPEPENTPTPEPENTPTPEPENTPTPEPENTPTPEPENTPTPEPENTPTPTPTPKPWTDKQLDKKDPIPTKDGKLTGLSVKLTKEYYTFGEKYQEEDGKVTATFLQEDGTKTEKELSYGGEDGYSVTLSTVKSGRQIAVFTYKGLSARAYYTVSRSYVYLTYMASYNGEVYSSDFPGVPLKNHKEDLYNELFKYTGAPYAYAIYGKFANLVETHRRYIAVLGDPEIRKEFADPALGNSYMNTVFLETGADGYLTNMLEGFRWNVQQKLVDTRSYLYYPIENWDEITRNVVNNVVTVPKGYKIRRVAEQEDTVQYIADQVLEKYTGSSSTLSVPMGVTKVALKEANTSVKTFEIPQSVQNIDVTSIAENLPNLQNYQVAEGDELRADFKIVDGILYSKDGKTLLSVPAGREKVEIPETVTTLGKDCLKGLSENAVIIFKSEKVPAVKTETGFRGIIQVPDSDGNTVYKNYMFRLGDECSNILFRTEGGQKDLYEYSSEGPVLLYRGQDTVLAAIPQDTRGEYRVAGNIKAVGENAFVGCNRITDIVLGENITELQNNSLMVSKHVDSITIKDPDIKISDHLFGTPGTDEINLNLKIYVPDENYDAMVSTWSDILDPVYGEGTAKALLCITNDSYIYEDGAKYQQIVSDGKIQYRLMRVYQTDKTSMQIKEGTSEIAAGAFAGCTDLEILYVPDTVETAGENFLGECSSLETVVSLNRELFVKDKYGAVSTAEIFTAGDTFTGFSWDEGTVYGETADGYTLLNVPTDYSETLKIRKGTSVFYKQALKGCESVRYIMILDDLALREIGEECFSNCAAINGVDLEACTNLTTIGDRAFYECTELAAILLPESLETIGLEAFYNCTLLEKVTAPAVRTVGDRAFYGCGSLMTTDMFNAVESLGDGAFYGCTGLTGVVLPETLQNMGESCFENCTMLKSITINGNITGISRYCFYGCKTLTDITFRDSGSRSGALRVIGVEAFGNCTGLETIDLGNLDSLTAMGEGVFTECESLTTVKLPKQLAKIPDNCFNGCKNLSIVQIESENVPQLGEKVFGDTLPSFLHIWVTDGMTEAYRNVYQPVLDPLYGEGTTESVLGVINSNQEIIRGVLFEITEEGRVLEKASTELAGEYLIPDDTVRIADNAFEGCDKLTGFGIPANATVSLGNQCFTGCSSLRTVSILGNVPEWGDETFMGCEALEKVYLGYSGDNTINRIGTRAFKNCTNLKTDAAFEIRAGVLAFGEECFAGCINLPAISTSDVAKNKLQRIENGTFRGCVSLRAFLVSKLSALTYIGDYAFANCDTLRQPSVPAGVSYIGEGCFMDCDNLQYVSFYGSIEEYPKYCFKNCPKLIRTGGLPVAFSGLKRIGESAYEGCVSLTASASWNLGKYTNLEEVGDSAFYGCATLADSVLSAKMTRIGAAAFEGCSSLHALWIQTEIPPAFGTFSGENMAEDFCIRVPDSEADGDSIYKSYLEQLTEAVGKEYAYQILDSFSDNAKDRQPENASEEPTEPEPETDEKTEETDNSETETQDAVGIIEDVPEEEDTEELLETPGDSQEENEGGNMMEASGEAENGDPEITEQPDGSENNNAEMTSDEFTSEFTSEQSPAETESEPEQYSDTEPAEQEQAKENEQ